MGMAAACTQDLAELLSWKRATGISTFDPQRFPEAAPGPRGHRGAGRSDGLTVARGAAIARRGPEPRRAPRSPIVPTARAAALGLLLLAGPAFAGASITKPFGEAHRDSLGPDGLPLPEVAAQLSANSTVVPFACGGAAALTGAAGGSAQLIVIGVAFAAVGVVLGPAAGYRYGDVPGHGRRGVVVRTVLVAGTPFVAAGVANTPGLDNEQRRARNFYCVLGGMGLAAIVAVWDVGHVEEAVRRHNDSAKPPAVSLGPAVAPFSRAPALAVRVGLGPGGD